ncbi:DUF748 domain-containing protein [Bdellovibrio sp. HCB288]|uniref:DUF748 domain-containing protein n=1 Tax=Bdellovibrio sp. HCB288 TaxID=3394355 RepID=UPI0039B37641
MEFLIRFQKLLIIGALIILIYTLLGFFLVPWIAKNQIQKFLQTRYGSTPTIGKIYFNPYTFHFEITDFDLPDTAEKTTDKISRLKFETFAMNGDWWKLLRREVHFKYVDLKKAEGQFIIFSKGNTNWELLPDPEADAKKKDDSKSSGKPWTVTFRRLAIENSGLDVWDHTHVSPLHLPIGPLNLNIENFTTSIGESSEIESLVFSVGDKGRMVISGSANMKPTSADLKLDFQDLPMGFLSAYLSDTTYLRLSKGTLNFQGNLVYREGIVALNGDPVIHDLAIEQEEVELPVLKWKTLIAEKFQFKFKPLGMTVENVNVDGLVTTLALRADGTLNVKEMMRTGKKADPAPQSSFTPAGPPAAAKQKESAPGFQYLVKVLKIENGGLDYSDQQIRPRFVARIHNLNGSLGPISSELGQKMSIDLNGMVEQYGKFKGKGSFITKKPWPNLDFTSSFQNIEMTTFTPYAGKFAGYEISKGKLFLDVKYTLVNHRIKGDNNVFLDQFTLGKKVEGGKQSNWPIKFALAIMKDRKGQIKFKLPIEGDVSSPDFSVGSIVWTAIKNLVVKIAMSPFDFISSLVGGGPELQNIFFAPGQRTLTAEEAVKVSKIAEALKDRPQLALEITGQYQQADLAEMLRSASQGKKNQDFTVDDLKALALARSNLIMGELNNLGVEPDRMFILAATPGEAGKKPQVYLKLKEK